MFKIEVLNNVNLPYGLEEYNASAKTFLAKKGEKFDVADEYFDRFAKFPKHIKIFDKKETKSKVIKEKKSATKKVVEEVKSATKKVAKKEDK